MGHLKATCRQSVHKLFLPEVFELHTCISIKFKPVARNEIECIFALITVKTSKTLESSFCPSIYLGFCTEEGDAIPHKGKENELPETVRSQ